VQSYRVQDQYDFLDSEDESQSEDSDARPKRRKPRVKDGDEEDADIFVPPEEEEQDEDLMDDEVYAEEDDDGGGEGMEGISRDESIVEIDSDNEISLDKQAEWKQEVINTDAAIGLQRNRPPKQPRPRRQRLGKSGPVKPLAQKSDGKAQTAGAEKAYEDREHHARGIDEWGRGARGGSIENRLKDLFGPNDEDIRPILQVRDWWMSQDTLPDREAGHLRHSFHVSNEAREREILKAREWYMDSGKKHFASGQRKRALSKHEEEAYMSNAGPKSQNLLMGPVQYPQLYTLKKGESLSTATPFESAKEGRRGWVLNLGARIQDAQWAPNEEGSTQYLAVVVEQTQTKRHHYKPLENPQAPAFNATPKFPSSIQIWAFESRLSGELDPSKSPRLELIICTDWGAPKQLRWCPIAITDSIESEEESMVHLGLLACIWSDGRLRILDISYQKPHADSDITQKLYYSDAAFEVQFPHTVPTCLHWLSGTSIAAATAAGTLAVWTLSRPDTFPSTETQSGQHQPKPWFYQQVSDTFILTLSSGFPSRPTYLSITTADGFGKLLDLRSPIADTTSSSRGRIFSAAQAWHEHAQSFLAPNEAYALRANTIRRYYSNIYVMSSDSQIVCCATSPVHPGVLLGGADGIVLASNPISRVLNAKEVPWQQTWFTHEWRPPVEELSLKVRGHGSTPTDDNDNEEQLQEISQVPQEVLSQPLIRITEGYKVQPANLQKISQEKHTKDFIKLVSIYEDASSITVVAWNPNLKFGTWAVAGTGSGLLRVEDLGI
jgi:transcription factor C subunit 6